MGQLFYVLDTELRYTGCFHTRKHRERGVRKEISIFRKRDLGFSPKARILLRLRYFRLLNLVGAMISGLAGRGFVKIQPTVGRG